MPRGEDDATLVIPTETDPPADAVAAWIHAALQQLPAPARLHAALVAHELLTDARGRRSAPYVLRLTTLDRRATLTVSVDDCTTDPDHPDENLVLVSGLCARLGVEQRRRGRTTWAELVVDAPDVRLSRPDQPVPRPSRGSTR